MSVLRNIMYLGYGVATLTREKVEQAVDELIKRGEVAGADRAKAIDELQAKAQTAAGEIRKMVDERLDSLGKRLRWNEEIARLRTEVEELKAKIDQLEKQPGKSGSSARKSTGGTAKS